jgi:hypothetical protein
MLPTEATSVSFPVAFYRGHHPYQVYVKNSAGMNMNMPITGYHDLRFLVAANQGMTRDAGADWLQSFTTPARTLAEYADESIAVLRKREEKLDVKISHQIDRADTNLFFSVNHPCNNLLASQASQIVRIKELSETLKVPSRQFLGSDISHIDGFVARANGSVDNDGVAAVYGGRSYTLIELWTHAQRWYVERPEAVALGIDEHMETINLLGLV